MFLLNNELSERFDETQLNEGEEGIPNSFLAVRSKYLK